MRSMIRRREYDTLPDESECVDSAGGVCSVVLQEADYLERSQSTTSCSIPTDVECHLNNNDHTSRHQYDSSKSQQQQLQFEYSSSASSATTWCRHSRDHDRALEIEPTTSLTYGFDVDTNCKDRSTKKEGRRRRRQRQKTSYGESEYPYQQEEDECTHPPLMTKSGLLLSHRRPCSSPTVVPNKFATSSVSYSPLSNHLTGTEHDGTPEVTPTHRHIHAWRQQLMRPSERWNSSKSGMTRHHMRQPRFGGEEEYNDKSSCAATLCTERRRSSLLPNYNDDHHMMPHHRVVLSPIRVWIALLVTCAIIGSGIACLAVHYHNHNNPIDVNTSTKLTQSMKSMAMRTAEKDSTHVQGDKSSIFSSVSYLEPTSLKSPIERSLSNFVKVDTRVLKHLQEVNQARKNHEQLNHDSMGLNAVLFAGDVFMKKPLERGSSNGHNANNSTKLDAYVINNKKDKGLKRQRRLQHQEQQGAGTIRNQELHPLEELSLSNMEFQSIEHTQQTRSQKHNNFHFELHHSHRHLSHLLEPFREWMDKHERQYHSHEDTHNRFLIWAHNHGDIAERNRRHGPCKLTGQPVFGSNKFQDLTDEEFNSQYLTGYNPPHLQRTPRQSYEKKNNERKLNKLKSEYPFGLVEEIEDDIPVLQPRHPVHGVKRHPKIQKAFEEQWYANMRQTQPSDNSNRDNVIDEPFFSTQSDLNSHGRRLDSSSMSSGSTYMAEASTSWCSFDICKWNIYCWINCIRSYYEGGSYGTMIPSKNNPWSTNDSDNGGISESVDWRKLGVVTDVHSQGQCGACWAITARETIESAYAIDSGTLLDLDETEVIICDSSCKMCNGGWPQNAYEFVQKIGGLQIKGSTSLTKYDGDFLLKLTMANQGYYDSMTDDEISYYKSLYCKASNGGQGGNNNDDGNDSRKGSDDQEEEGRQQEGEGYGASTYITSSSMSSSSSSSSSVQRYGKIKGYGYTTNKCVCYTNGSGCDCDSQDETLAVQNLATYGPATVCLDAANWKQYTGGILTADVGCSAAFLDMNHCVQVVGYAYLNSNSNGDEDEYYYDEENSNSQSNKSNNNGSNKDGNGDDDREGYFIVRNQWSNSWGMNGYAYVAMGSNTCGILNDMTNVFMS